MGFGTLEKLAKQEKFEKANGKSKSKIVMKKAKKQPKNVSTIVKGK